MEFIWNQIFKIIHVFHVSYSLRVQMVTEGYFTEKFGNNSETRVAGVFNHMRTFFAHPSLPVKFNLIRLPTKTLSERIIVTPRMRE